MIYRVYKELYIYILCMYTYYACVLIGDMMVSWREVTMSALVKTKLLGNWGKRIVIKGVEPRKMGTEEDWEWQAIKTVDLALIWHDSTWIMRDNTGKGGTWGRKARQSDMKLSQNFWRLPHQQVRKAQRWRDTGNMCLKC